MTDLLEVPLDTGASVLVEVGPSEVPRGDGLVLASNIPGVVGRAAVSLEDALDRLEPVVKALAARLTSAGPDEMSVEFGIKLGGETGVILAKGTAEVNFKVAMSWHREPQGRA